MVRQDQDVRDGRAQQQQLHTDVRRVVTDDAVLITTPLQRYDPDGGKCCPDEAEYHRHTQCRPHAPRGSIAYAPTHRLWIWTPHRIVVCAAVLRPDI